MAKLLLLACFFPQTWVADKHAEAFGKRCDLRLAVIRRDIVYSDTFAALQTKVDHLGDALECAISRFEVEVRGPVVADSTVRTIDTIARFQSTGTTYLKSSEKSQVVQLAVADGSSSSAGMEALKALPPTT